MSRLVVLILLASLLLGACGPHYQPQDCARPDVFCAGLVTDFGTVDTGIAQQAWLALRDAQDEHIVDRIDSIETMDSRDRAANIRAFAEAGYDVIVTVGSPIAKETSAAAAKYPGLLFIGVEQPQDTPLPNLAGLVFHEDRSAFLAGALAALMTRTGHVGAVCEPDYIDAMRRYCDGFKAGATYASPKIVVDVTYRQGNPEDLFNSPDWGSQAATDELKAGVDVLFAAGGQTADGALQAAASQGAYVIGSESDRYLDLPAIRSRLLTSATNNVRTGVLKLLKLARRGELPSGDSMAGVSLAPWHDLDTEIPDAVKKEIQSIEARLERNAIGTNVPYQSP